MVKGDKHYPVHARERRYTFYPSPSFTRPLAGVPTPRLPTAQSAYCFLAIERRKIDGQSRTAATMSDDHVDAGSRTMGRILGGAIVGALILFGSFIFVAGL